MNQEFIPWRPVVLLEKFDRDQVAWVRGKTGLLEPDGDALSAHVTPYDTMQFAGNLLTTAGLGKVSSLLIGAGATALNAANSRVGVGDNAAGAVVGDTALTTGTASYFRLNDATYPQQASGVVTMKASFADAEANFAWACWGIDSGTANGQPATAPLVNRKVQAMGTKTSGVWALTVTLTFS